mgnify:CR=1 FL=1
MTDADADQQGKHQTWNGKPSPYWQHNEPIRCPKKHLMIWLGQVFWLCSKCHTIYGQIVAR